MIIRQEQAQYPARHYAGWSDDARKAIVENPDYFVWWYTVKSVGLALLFGAFCYQLGRRK